MGDLIKVAPGKVKILSNVRTILDKSGIETLAKSIRENGLIQPITVRKGKGNTWELITGQRRLLASRKAKMGLIPAYVIKSEDNNIAVLQTIENTEREDLSPLEEAYAYVRMTKVDALTPKEISIKMNKSLSEIKLLLQIDNAIPELIKLYEKENIGLEKVLTVAKYPKKIQKETIDNNLSLILYNGPKEIERRILQSISTNLSDAPFALDTIIPNTHGICNGCEFSTKANKELFDSKENLCTDLKCYRTKVEYVIDQAIEKAKRQDPKVYLISTLANTHYKGKEILSIGDYNSRVKDYPKCTPVLSVIVDGAKAGTITPILLMSEIKKLERKEREQIYKSGDAKEIAKVENRFTPDVRYREKLKTYSRERNAAIMKNFYKAILETKEITINEKIAIKLICDLLEHLDYNYQKRIAEYLGAKGAHLVKIRDKIKDFPSAVKLVYTALFNYEIEQRSDDDDDLVMVQDFLKLIMKGNEIEKLQSQPLSVEKENAKQLLTKFEEKWNRKPITKG